MYKNLTTTQLILIALAAVLLLLATFAFYLLQDPAAPLPFLPAPATSTTTTASNTTAPTSASSPTRRTSYTPLAAFLTPDVNTPSPVSSSQTTPFGTPIPPPITPGITAQASTPTQAVGNPYPIGSATNPVPSPTRTTGATPSGTPPTPTRTASVVPSVTSTLAPGEVAVSGRIILRGTPAANVLVSFADDTAPRQSLTDTGGHYFFKTLAPGTSFLLTFKQSDNPNLGPPPEIASALKVEGTLPSGVNPIDFPDVELSLNLSGNIFQPLTPNNGDSFHASVINSSNRIQFVWSSYSLGGSYIVELGPLGSDEPLWSSPLVADTSVMWDGTLTDGTHITQGAYWWRVSATKSLGNYVEVIYTQLFHITFTP